MPDRSRRQRAGRARLVGQRAAALAVRRGVALRAARLRAGLTQRELGAAAGVSQGWVSEAERAKGASGSLETWASLAAGVGLQLASFLELTPGATPPRDHQHLRRQQGVVVFAAPGGWDGRPEVRIVTADGVQRFIDVQLDRDATNETVVVEIVDLLADVGEDLRGLERKVEAIRRQRPGRRVAGLLVIRATKRNRDLVNEFRELLRARFSSGAAWLAALRGPDPLPPGDGILWSGAVEPTISAMQLGPRPRDRKNASRRESSARTKGRGPIPAPNTTPRDGPANGVAARAAGAFATAETPRVQTST